MPITVKEIMRLPEFQNFTLIAGRSGERNQIMNIGILDYEYANEDPELERLWAFGKNAFVISSMLFAKDHPERIMPCIKGLVRDGVAALAFKTIYYDTLPKEALEYANEWGLPVYTFGRDDAYFQDITILIKEKMEERDDTELLEQKINLFLNGNLSIANRRELFQEIFPGKKYDRYLAVYCNTKALAWTLYYVRNLEELQGRLGKEDSVFRYQNGYLVILDMDDTKRNGELKTVVSRILQLREKDYYIGIGNIHTFMDDMNLAIQEGLYASQYSRLTNSGAVSFQHMGIYQILLPYCRDPWMIQYCRSILDPILEFDRQYDGELFRTAELYVKLDGDVEAVGNQLHLHKNTVRYRMNRIKDLIGVESRFDEQLFVAFRTWEIQKDVSQKG